jgi:ABC-type sugar transport system permease subunit
VKARGRTTFILSFLSPAVFIYAVFVVIPLAQSFQMSLYRWRGVSQNRQFIGLENFRNLVGDSLFWKTLQHNLWFLLIGGLIIFALGLSVAAAMQRDSKIVRITRAVILLPQVISLVVVAILWMFLYNPSFGLLNSTLEVMHFDSLSHAWLGESKTALPAVGIAFIWYVTGFYVMLFGAGIKAIPEEVIEAAELDGSKGFHKFRAIVWPLLWSVKRVAAVYVVANVMNVFALVFLMTRGGPDRHTEVMLTYLYEKAFSDSQFGYAASLAVVNFLTAMLLSAGILAWMRKNPTEVRA